MVLWRHARFRRDHHHLPLLRHLQHYSHRAESSFHGEKIEICETRTRGVESIVWELLRRRAESLDDVVLVARNAWNAEHSTRSPVIS